MSEDVSRRDEDEWKSVNQKESTSCCTEDGRGGVAWQAVLCAVVEKMKVQHWRRPDVEGDRAKPEACQVMGSAPVGCAVYLSHRYHYSIVPSTALLVSSVIVSYSQLTALCAVVKRR